MENNKIQISSMTGAPHSHWHCRYSNFDWSDGKKLLQDHLDKFAQGKRKGFVFIGNPGVGKTHLMVAVYADLQIKGFSPGSDIIFFCWEELLNYLRDSMSFKIRADGLIAKICATKYLILDDIKPDAEGSSQFWKQMLEGIIETAYNNETKLILSTNADNKEELVDRWCLSDYHVSRLSELCDVILLKGKDRRIER